MDAFMSRHLSMYLSITSATGDSINNTSDKRNYVKENITAAV